MCKHLKEEKKILSCARKRELITKSKKRVKKATKNEYSALGEDWTSTPCRLKRCDLTYDDAQMELARMQRESDTEEERLPRKRYEINITDMSEALQCKVLLLLPKQCKSSI